MHDPPPSSPLDDASSGKALEVSSVSPDTGQQESHAFAQGLNRPSAAGEGGQDVYQGMPCTVPFFAQL